MTCEIIDRFEARITALETRLASVCELQQEYESIIDHLYDKQMTPEEKAKHKSKMADFNADLAKLRGLDKSGTERIEHIKAMRAKLEVAS